MSGDTTGGRRGGLRPNPTAEAPTAAAIHQQRKRAATSSLRGVHLPAAVFPSANLHTTFSQSIPNATWTTVNMLQVGWDNEPRLVASIALDRIDVLHPGIYGCYGHARWEVHGLAQFAVRVVRGPTTHYVAEQTNTGLTAESVNRVVSCFQPFPLYLGEYVYLQVFQNIGLAKTLQGSGATNMPAAALSITWMAPYAEHEIYPP